MVSIITPCYNVEDYIEECVHSAFAQTYTNIEVICIDNNSTDQTWEKLVALQKTYPSLIIDKELKPGAPAARNKGIALAKGEWIQFLDADDLLLPNKIEHQVKLIQEQPNAAFIAGACIKRDVEGEETTSLPKEGNPFKSLFITQMGITSSNLWNRTYLEKIDGWDETLKSSQEADLMFRLLQISEEVIIDKKPLTIVRERHFGQISTNNQTENWERYILQRINILEWLSTNKKDVYERNYIYFELNIFNGLKVLSTLNINKANKFYKEHLKIRYKKQRKLPHKIIAYNVFYSIFGFISVEKKIQTFKKLRQWKILL